MRAVLMEKGRAFLRDQTGASAAEFALVALAFIVAMLAIMEFGRLAWELNSAKAATRAGARFAVVSPMVSETYADYDGLDHTYVDSNGNTQNYGNGQAIKADALAKDTCTESGCTGGSANTAAFDAVVTYMHSYFGRVTPGNVVIEYENTGLGVAGLPDMPDLQPLVTVRIQNMTYSPGVLQIFGVAPFLLPDVATTLSGEDLG
jgi:Flp pilus assembly protein TadG